MLCWKGLSICTFLFADAPDFKACDIVESEGIMIDNKKDYAWVRKRDREREKERKNGWPVWVFVTVHMKLHINAVAFTSHKT